MKSPFTNWTRERLFRTIGWDSVVSGKWARNDNKNESSDSHICISEIVSECDTQIFCGHRQ